MQNKLFYENYYNLIEKLKTKPTERQLACGGSDYVKLKDYMKKNIPFAVILDFKLLEEKYRYNYYVQAECICKFFGISTVFEYTNIGKALKGF